MCNVPFPSSNSIDSRTLIEDIRMQRQEATQVLEALQSFASLLEKDGLYTEAHQKAFERTALLLSK